MAVIRQISDAQKRPARALGYARVSSAAQAIGSSLEDQKTAISAHAAALGVSVTRFYVEAESAVHEKIERREQVRALMADARAGDLVLVALLDRWSRDPEFTYSSIRQLHERGAKFYAVGDQCDPSTAEGDTMLNFRVLFAREEHKRIKRRTVGTRRLLRDRGYYSEGLPPFGYRRSLPKGTKGIEKNVLRVDEREAAIVREIFRLCADGRSLTQIARTVSMERSRVAKAVRSRLYLGEMQDSAGRLIKGMHPAIVDAHLFVRAQTALDGRRLGGPRPHAAPSETSDWMLRDLARCALCDARMSAAYAGPREKRRYYYACSHRCTTRYVNVRVVEAAADPLVLARLEHLRHELAAEPKRTASVSTLTPAIAQRRARLQRKRERTIEAFTDGHMTREEMRAAMTKIDAEALRLDTAIAPAPTATLAARRAALREVERLRQAWAGATLAEKRRLVGHLAIAVRMSAGSRPAFVWRPVEDLAGRGLGGAPPGGTRG